MIVEKKVSRAPRYAVHLEVEYRLPTSPDSPATIWQTGTSENVSACGVFFSTSREGDGFVVDMPIELRLVMPPQLSSRNSARANCIGRIVRIVRIVSEAGGGFAHVAATIDRYRFECDGGSDDWESARRGVKAIAPLIRAWPVS